MNIFRSDAIAMVFLSFFIEGKINPYEISSRHQHTRILHPSSFIINSHMVRAQPTLTKFGYDGREISKWECNMNHIDRHSASISFLRKPNFNFNSFKAQLTAIWIFLTFLQPWNSINNNFFTHYLSAQAFLNKFLNTFPFGFMGLGEEGKENPWQYLYLYFTIFFRFMTREWLRMEIELLFMRQWRWTTYASCSKEFV